MDAQEYDKIVANNKLPSHEWAKNNVHDLGAIMEVADAERLLVEAVNVRKERDASNVAWVKEGDDNNVNTALFHLANMYLTYGVAANEETAVKQAKRAMRTMNHCLSHESVAHAR
jgi:hypothetical protein